MDALSTRDMNDITRCVNAECDYRNLCLRAQPSEDPYQSYTYFEPDTNGECKGFVAYEDGNAINKDTVTICTATTINS